MTQLGTLRRPAVVRVQTRAKAEAVLALCERFGWQVIVGVEPGKPEDVSDVERLLHPEQPVQVVSIGRNDPCTCGSGRKYKKCCGAPVQSRENSPPSSVSR
jgi:SWIM/SEC-C metal-binding protein